MNAHKDIIVACTQFKDWKMDDIEKVIYATGIEIWEERRMRRKKCNGERKNIANGLNSRNELGRSWKVIKYIKK